MKDNKTEERIFTLNLHGLSVEEALTQLRTVIDKCFYYRYNKLRVIHGTGSGKLMDMTYKEAMDNMLIKSLDPCDKGNSYTDLILEDINDDVNK
jgi:dsDNA-specific endonuclease/ATPase MutS2